MHSLGHICRDLNFEKAIFSIPRPRAYILEFKVSVFQVCRVKEFGCVRGCKD